MIWKSTPESPNGIIDTSPWSNNRHSRESSRPITVFIQRPWKWSAEVHAVHFYLYVCLLRAQVHPVRDCRCSEMVRLWISVKGAWDVGTPGTTGERQGRGEAAWAVCGAAQKWIQLSGSSLNTSGVVAKTWPHLFLLLEVLFYFLNIFFYFLLKYRSFITLC